MLSMRMEQLSGWETEFTGAGETWALLKATKLERKVERNGIVFWSKPSHPLNFLLVCDCARWLETNSNTLKGSFREEINNKDGRTHQWRGHHDSIAAFHGALFRHQGDNELDDEHAGEGAVEAVELDEVHNVPTRLWVGGPADLHKKY